MDAHAAWRVRRVRAHWVHVGGAGNVVVGLERAHWGRSERAGGRVSKRTGRAETCLLGPGFISTVLLYGMHTVQP